MDGKQVLLALKEDSNTLASRLLSKSGSALVLLVVGVTRIKRL